MPKGSSSGSSRNSSKGKGTLNLLSLTKGLGVAGQAGEGIEPEEAHMAEPEIGAGAMHAGERCPVADAKLEIVAQWYPRGRLGEERLQRIAITARERLLRDEAIARQHSALETAAIEMGTDSPPRRPADASCRHAALDPV